MKKLWLIAITAFVLLAPMAGLSSAQDVQNFSVQSFDADYYLTHAPDNSSRMAVDEVIVAVFPNFDQNHGILRAIPKTYNGHSLRITNINVQDGSGRNYDYTTYDQNSNLVLKIGSADTYVHGAMTYKIHYELSDVISFYKDHDELFWDINGDQWSQPFDEVTARLHIPGQLADSLNQNQVCYTGTFGSKNQDCQIVRKAEASGVVVTALAKNIYPQSTMSVALSFKPGTFKLSSAAAHDALAKKLYWVGLGALAILPPIITFIILFTKWRRYGDDPKGRGVIVPQYEPPKDFSALMSDFMLHTQFSKKAVGALLIDLAVNGYLAIYEVPKKGLLGHKSYELEIRKDVSGLSPECTRIINEIFGSAPTVGRRENLREVAKGDTTMYVALNDAEKKTAIELTTLGYYKKDPSKIRKTYFGWGHALLFGAIYGMAFAHFPVAAAIGAGIFIIAILLYIFGYIMPARTDIGVDAYDRLLGLKEYIKLAEADRLKYLQSPEGAEKIIDKESFNPSDPAMRVKLFEKLLPYAIIFGLEKEWAKQFENLYTNPPNWYYGNWAAFNTGYLVGSINDFNSFNASNFAPPSSSGSGFGGGGAGGGGGGGGGGGW